MAYAGRFGLRGRTNRTGDLKRSEPCSRFQSYRCTSHDRGDSSSVLQDSHIQTTKTTKNAKGDNTVRFNPSLSIRTLKFMSNPVLTFRFPVFFVLFVFFVVKSHVNVPQSARCASAPQTSFGRP